ncbi:alcohol dehydrogenase [Microdochium trichocladiopsis]|uniref:Alcohol dehydrogenase n=1 Tax=Microdochium trichocladiopsis TaxID=1682393 RepID=A0A9P8XRP5_9PEZI|nr:alcohol dehydrogenase [Microdochium trichocladiopsis]KAH7014167.1 alcohol dehydrogenase [Microdochium trichocladiopsis]
MNRAIVYTNPGTIETEVIEKPIEEPAPGEVLLRLHYSGVCHTDYGICTNVFATLPPTPKGQIGGHEGVGEVIKLGPGTTSLKLGDLVGVKWSASACLSCGNCLEGGETTCPAGTISGFMTPGTFQQYCLAPANYVTPIPRSLDPAGAAALMCGGITVYTALKRAEVKHGQWVVVLGAGGGLGHLAIQYAVALGTRVVALDVGAKEEFCLGLGARAFVDFTKFAGEEDGGEQLAARVKELTGGAGAKVVLACSSSNKSYAQAVGLLGFRGTLVCIGVPEGGPEPIGGANAGDMITRELKIFALKSGNRADAKECLDIATAAGIKTRYELRPIDSLTQVFKDMEEGKINGRVVLDLR